MSGLCQPRRPPAPRPRSVVNWLHAHRTANVEQVWLLCSRTPRVAGRGSDDDPVD